MKKQICLLVLCLPFIVIAQDSVSTGIKWTTSLSWEQVKQKAKAENKYIFLDCFTTWCGPCKAMDKYVYPNDTVGDFFNDKFISVKVQMDQAGGDNELVKSWYKDAEEIGKRFLVEGYPTFLFFSPNSEIVNKDVGFRDNRQFIDLAKLSLTPGRTFNDDVAVYTQLMNDYKRGDIKYDRLPFMVTIAKKVGDTVSRKLVRLHEQYESKLSAKERYTKDNIAFWSTLNLTGDSKLVQFFFRDGQQIDRVMQKKGYARAQIDKWIQSMTVLPFIIEEQQKSAPKFGVTTINNATGAMISDETDYKEADWEKLEQLIRKSFGRSYVKSNLLKAKSIWYEKNSNWPAYARMSIEKFKIDPPDFEEPLERVDMNGLGWKVFMFVNDKQLINDAIVWMKKLVESPFLPSQSSDALDTYANLLYKVGRKAEAIQWQEKAVNAEPNRGTRKLALEEMKKGGKPYGVEAITTAQSGFKRGLIP